MTVVQILWVVLLVVTVLVIPFIVRYLHKVYVAARSIERYFKEMKEAGIGIARNTEHIKALDDTISVASDILETAGKIDKNAETLEGALSSRAKQNV